MLATVPTPSRQLPCVCLTPVAPHCRAAIRPQLSTARRRAEQEAGKRQALVIDLTLDDPPIKMEEESAAAAVAPRQRRQGRGGGRAGAQHRLR